MIRTDSFSQAECEPTSRNKSQCHFFGGAKDGYCAKGLGKSKRQKPKGSDYSSEWLSSK